MKAIHVQPIVLEDQRVRLEPLNLKHTDGLLACLELSTFEYMPSGPTTKTTHAIETYIKGLTTREDQIAFVIIDKQRSIPIGTTSYMHIRPEHRGLEIGCTWITSSARGTGINLGMKRLLLEHAFDRLDAIRVELCTDALNKRSRRAIEKLGAVQEGVLASHMVMPCGRLRNTALYSITSDRWNEVRAMHGWSTDKENPSHRGSDARD